MKKCPKCNKNYEDLSLKFCLDDGSPLEHASVHLEETVVMQPPDTAKQDEWATQPAGWNAPQQAIPQKSGARRALPWVIAALIVVILGCGGVIGFLAYLGLQSDRTQETDFSATPTQVEPGDAPDAVPTTDKTVTMAKFEAIKNGMRRAQVEEIMGRKGTETFSSEVAGMSVVSMEWKDGPFKMILVSFQNDKVTYKMQIGLAE